MTIGKRPRTTARQTVSSGTKGPDPPAKRLRSSVQDKDNTDLFESSEEEDDDHDEAVDEELGGSDAKFDVPHGSGSHGGMEGDIDSFIVSSTSTAVSGDRDGGDSGPVLPDFESSDEG